VRFVRDVYIVTTVRITQLAPLWGGPDPRRTDMSQQKTVQLASAMLLAALSVVGVAATTSAAPTELTVKSGPPPCCPW
jgi:hypothetical protein